MPKKLLLKKETKVMASATDSANKFLDKFTTRLHNAQENIELAKLQSMNLIKTSVVEGDSSSDTSLDEATNIGTSPTF